MKILLTGATGLIGKEIGKALVRQGHELVVISRNARKARMECPFPCEVVEGDLVKAPVRSDLLLGIEGVIHLMGESVADGRWNAAKKAALTDSRIQSTRHLRESLGPSLKVIVSSSGIGFYGDRGDEELTEDSAPGSDFLAELCVAWEKEVRQFREQGVRTVAIRTGLVISRSGGVLPALLTPFRAGVGGPLGSGRGWMSWIHIDDLVKMYVEALEDPRFEGAINGVAPRPVRNSEFTSALASLLHRPGLFPIPTFGLKALFGEKSVIMVASQKVVCRQAQKLGFSFAYVDLASALQQQIGNLGIGEDLLVAEQYLPLLPEQIFPFFCDAKNLGTLTPALLDFKILSQSTAELGEGTLIDYRLKIHGVPVHWQTRIESWSPPFQFVDTQLKGPYQLWHHTHSFARLGAGTLMTDRVRYRLPLGYLGWMGGSALVKHDTVEIFNYRRKVIDELFVLPSLVSSSPQ